MPEPGAQQAKTDSHVCHCQCEAEFQSASHNKDTSPKKEACSSRQDECLSNIHSKSELHGGSFLPLDQGTRKKWHLNHWWEAPDGFGSRGRAASCMLSTHEQMDSPAHSDLTFDGGIVSSLTRDRTLKGAPANFSAFPKGSIFTQRVCDFSSEQVLDASTSSRLDNVSAAKEGAAEPDKTLDKSEAIHSKDRPNRWTDEDGKMVIHNDVFDAILPSFDEVGLQWRISELRIALRASESARLESEMETEALRKYLADVEAAAAGLQSRVQELEHLVTFSAKDESRELEQLRAKLVMEVSKEARTQTAKAAKAVAAAREATMELDKVKRHASSLIKSQEEEVERLRMEAAECRTLYHARAAQLQGMKEQIERIEQNLQISTNGTNEALKASQEEVLALQKCLEEAKMEGQEKSKQFSDLLEAFEMQTKALQSAENRLKDLEREKTELSNHSEWLEQQVASLQSNGVAAANYDHEIQKVRAMLGAEKQHLLSELALLRQGNQNLQVELVEWQEKFHSLNKRVSSPTMATQGTDALAKEEAFHLHSNGNMQEGQDNIDCLKSTAEETVIEGQGDTTPIKDSMRSHSLCSCQKRRVKQSANDGLSGHCSSHSRESGGRLSGLQERRARGNDHHRTNCSLLQDDLLAAAHREIVKLKEINQYLMSARHGKMWCNNNHAEKENFTHM